MVHKVDHISMEEYVMSQQSETYKGREITIKTQDNGPQLYIDGAHIEIAHDEDADTYASGYHAYQSVRDLAKALIDDPSTGFSDKPGT
jgi:hypothetical protein